MKRVLCYGDSNTFGVNPHTNLRWDEHTRWTGVLQDLLGDGWTVIEEGMCGRNTMFDDPTEAGRNGLAYLPVSLSSHRPLDLVILMLGTNDTKTIFGASTPTIARGVALLVDCVRKFFLDSPYGMPKILVVAPPAEGAGVEHSRFVAYDHASYEKSLSFGPVFRRTCEDLRVPFFDAGTVCVPGCDELHMDRESHRRLAEALAPIVRDLVRS